MSRPLPRRCPILWGALVTLALTALLAVPALATTTVVDIDRGAYQGDDDTWYYTPEEVQIAPGGSVTWRNPARHGLVGSADDHPTSCVRETRRGRTKGDCPFGTFQLPPGSTHTVDFPEEGTFQYVCALHAWMVGTVVVGSGNPPADEPQPPPSPEETQPPSPPQETENDRAEEAPPAGDGAPTDTADNVNDDHEDATPADGGNQQETDEAVGEEQLEPDPTHTEDGDDRSDDQDEIRTIAADGPDGTRHRAALIALAGALLLAAIGGQYKMRDIRG